jgi:N-acetylneuraminic acid mutarotase
LKRKLLSTVLFFGLITVSAFSQKIVWKPKKEIPQAVQAGNSVVLDDEIYLIAGQFNNAQFYTETYKYNSTTDTWLELANVPSEKTNFAALTIDDTIYTIGGDPFSNKNEAFNNSTWQTKAPMTTARQHVAGCELNGIAYVLGGLESWEIVSDKVEAYNPATDSWTSPTTLPIPKHNIIAASYNDEIYVIGGEILIGTDIWPISQTLEIYNVNSNEWRTGSNLPEPICQGRTIIYNNEIYVIGGWTYDDNGDFVVTNSVWIYNPETDIWRTSTSTPLPVSTCGTTIVDNNIYLMGGFRDDSFVALSENLEGTIIPSGNFIPEVYYPLSDTTCKVDELFSWELPDFTFIDDDTLSYSASLTNDTNLPSWLFFNTDDVTLTGMPEMEDTLSIIITAIDNYGVSVSDTLRLVIELAVTGIDQFTNKDDLLFFPNPAKKYIQIRASDHQFKIKKFQIFTIDGKIVKEGRLESEQINISDLNKGVFLLNIKTDERIIIKKIVIN